MYRLITTFTSAEFEVTLESDAYTLQECASMQRRHADALKSHGCQVIVDSPKIIAVWPNDDMTIVDCVRA